MFGGKGKLYANTLHSWPRGCQARNLALRILKSCGVVFLIAGDAAAGELSRRRAFQVEDAGDKVAEGDTEVAPEAALEAGVILGTAEQVAHQLAKHGPTAHELNQPCRDRSPQECPAIEATDDLRGKLQF